MHHSFYHKDNENNTKNGSSWPTTFTIELLYHIHWAFYFCKHVNMTKAHSWPHFTTKHINERNRVVKLPMYEIRSMGFLVTKSML